MISELLFQLLCHQEPRVFLPFSSAVSDKSTSSVFMFARWLQQLQASQPYMTMYRKRRQGYESLFVCISLVSVTSFPEALSQQISFFYFIDQNWVTCVCGSQSLAKGKECRVGLRSIPICPLRPGTLLPEKTSFC